MAAVKYRDITEWTAQIVGSDKMQVGVFPAGAFACAQCGRSFGTKSLLTRHAAVVHTTERPFPCEDCGRAFKSRTNLKVSQVPALKP